MMDFLFGGRTGIRSPDELARRRELVRALIARASGQAPQNIWEGLNSLTEAIGGRIEEGRLDAAEAAGRRSADEKFRSFLKGGPGGQAGDAAWLEAMSDPWMPESRREALKFHRQQQFATSTPKTPNISEPLHQGVKQPGDGVHEPATVNDPQIKVNQAAVQPDPTLKTSTPSLPTQPGVADADGWITMPSGIRFREKK